MMFPVEGPIIAQVTRHEAHSALPDAPVVPDEPRPARRTRRGLARTLRRLADRLEPPRCVDPVLRPYPQ